jgi:glycosyltransferase involved in cell wall biosynthesis
MRVAVVGDYPLDHSRLRGGVQAAFAYLVQGLAEIEELELHVLTMKPSRDSDPEKKSDRFTVHLLDAYPRLERLRNYRTYQSTLNHKLAEIRPAVIHAQGTDNHGYVAVRSGYPTAITVHGIRSEDRKHLGSIGERLRGLFDGLVVERYIMRHVRHLIAISPYVTSYFARVLPPDVSVYHIPNAISRSYFELSDSTSSFNVLFAGRVIPRKRVLDLVHAFVEVVKNVPSAQLRIAGECKSEPAYAAAVNNAIIEANLQTHVHLLGPLTEKAVLEEFGKCALLALPSSQETTPMVIAQAMAARKPVVATAVGGIPGMIQDGETGFLLSAGDINGISAAILRLLEDPMLRARFGHAAYAVAKANYHVDAVARHTFEVYQRIAAQEPMCRAQPT